MHATRPMDLSFKRLEEGISPYFSEQFYDRNKLTIPVSIRRRRKKTRKKMDRRQWTKHISSPLKCDFYYVILLPMAFSQVDVQF